MSFKFETDVAGRKYATMAHDEVSKNHPGGLKDREKEVKMYETKDENGGYKALKLYLQKVNSMCSLFSISEDAVWYEAPPVGINGLGQMIKTISDKAHLSKT